MIKAVPQTYAGTRFRSTLEADWAATLDALRVQWRYEPGAIELPSGTLYRPDFWLPQPAIWLEVKGPGIPGAEKAGELAWTIGRPVVIGQAPREGRTEIQVIGSGWAVSKSESFLLANWLCRVLDRAQFVRAPR